MIVVKSILFIAAIGNVLVLLIWKHRFCNFMKVNGERLIKEMMPEINRHLRGIIVLIIVGMIIGVVSFCFKHFML